MRRGGLPWLWLLACALFACDEEHPGALGIPTVSSPHFDAGPIPPFMAAGSGARAGQGAGAGGATAGTGSQEEPAFCPDQSPLDGEICSASRLLCVYGSVECVCRNQHWHCMGEELELDAGVDLDAGFEDDAGL